MNQHRLLVEGLLGDDPRLHSMFDHSPEFRTAVETTARTFPPLMQLLADDAARRAQARERSNMIVPPL
jgi:hypothetical protein